MIAIPDSAGNPDNQARLILEPAQRTADGSLRFAASLLEADGTSQHLWWETSASLADAVTPAADPWLVGLIFSMMQRPRSVHVEGQASPSLLENLEHFTSIWHAWKPDKYHEVKITADCEEELMPIPEPGKTLVSFSCGIDACFTAYRHMRGLVGRRTRPIDAGVIQYGFDIELGQTESQRIFDRVHADAETMLASLGLECISLKTNFHKLQVQWADA